MRIERTHRKLPKEDNIYNFLQKSTVAKEIILKTLMNGLEKVCNALEISKEDNIKQKNMDSQRNVSGVTESREQLGLP